MQKFYSITLGRGFTPEEISAIYAAVQAVGAKFSQAIGGGLSSGEAFTQVYGYLFIASGCPTSVCGDIGGITDSAHNIKFSHLDSGFLRARNNMVHELGHAFNDSFTVGNQPAYFLGCTQTLTAGCEGYYEQGFPNRPDFPSNTGPNWIGPNSGFASGQNQYTWQQSYALAGSTHEEFADQFLGWTFNTWQQNDGSVYPAGPMRSAWMVNYMTGWINR